MSLSVAHRGVKMKFVRVFAVVVALTFVPTASAAPFLLRATANVQQLGNFNVTKNPTLRGLTKVFGPADDCRKHGWFSTAVWRTPGFRVRLTSLGSLSPGKTFCTDPKVFIDSIVVTGKRWHTRRGLYAGDSLTKFHRLYPHARRFRNGWGISMAYARCGAGVCNGAFRWVAFLTAAFQHGHVASFGFQVGAEGD
jgi:hypothetical protein